MLCDLAEVICVMFTCMSVANCTMIFVFSLAWLYESMPRLFQHKRFSNFQENYEKVEKPLVPSSKRRKIFKTFAEKYNMTSLTCKLTGFLGRKD